MKKQKPDPFVVALNDFLNGHKDISLLIKTNKGEDEIMPVSYFFRTYDEMPEIEKMALHVCSGHVLDVGAGTGCHSLVLQERGFDVTALDIKPAFIEIMQKRGVRNTEVSDFFKFRKESYDTILVLMNGVGISGNLQGLERFLKHCRRLLSENGQILLDSCDLMYLHQVEDGAIHINLNEEYHGELTYEVEYSGIKGTPFNWLFVDFSTLEQFAVDQGFNIELLYEGGHFSYLARLY